MLRDYAFKNAIRDECSAVEYTLSVCFFVLFAFFSLFVPSVKLNWMGLGWDDL